MVAVVWFRRMASGWGPLIACAILVPGQRSTSRFLPARIGPAEFSLLGKLVANRAPRELDAIFR